MAKKDLLQEVADFQKEHGVVIEVDEDNTNAEISAALADAKAELADKSPDAVSPEEVEEASEEADEAGAEEVKEEVLEEVEEVESDEVIVKMTRLNHSYQIMGYKFSQENPYGVVKSEHVDWLVKEDGGFRIATESEVRDFYG